MEERQDQERGTQMPSLISEELRERLLMVLGDRVNSGQILVSEGHFNQAMEEGYQALTGGFASQEVKAELGEIVDEVNRKNPETFLIPGVENWITQSVMAVVRQKKWGITEVQERGQGEVRDFLRHEKTRTLLEQLELTPNQLNTRNCMRTIISQVAGKPEPKRKQAAARLARLMESLKAQQKKNSGGEKLSRLLAGPAALPDEREVASRTAEQKKLQVKLRREQMDHLIGNLDAYVEQGMLSAEDAEKLHQVHAVEQAVRKGKASKEQGSKVRNSILTGQVRDRIERQVRDAVDYVVVYRQVFESLKKIDPKYDDGLRFLIRHKGVVNADTRGGEEWREVTENLIEELETLHLLIGIMDRQDAEVRMIAARLPPYSYVVKRGQDRIENMVIDEGFITALRQASGEEIAGKLSGLDRRSRARTAAAMLCLNTLVNRLIKPTPFRKEVRILKINLIIEEFYRSTEDTADARAKAQEFLRGRLRSLFPDLSPEESAEIQQRGAEMIEAAEKRVLEERREAAERRKGEEGVVAKGEIQDDRLTEEEVAQGVQLGRVAVRTAAGMRLVPYKIVPDPEEKGKFLLGKRNPESGELEPVMRRGVKRHVTRNREGIWEIN